MSDSRIFPDGGKVVGKRGVRKKSVESYRRKNTPE